MAGIAAGGRTPERVQASIYALDVVKGYFLSRGRELKVGDPAKVLERMLDYINAKLHQQSRSKGREFLTDLNLFACTEDRLCVVGTGGAAVFLSHQGKAKKVLGDEAASDLLGRGKGVHFSRLDSPVWSGDLVIMVSPALAEVFGNREISLVVQKAGDPDKAAMLINALASRKQLEGDLVSLFWEVPLQEKSGQGVFRPRAHGDNGIRSAHASRARIPGGSGRAPGSPNIMKRRTWKRCRNRRSPPGCWGKRKTG